MGYITRRLTYQVGARRFSLPAQFLSAHGLEAQARLQVAAPDAATRLLFSPAQWEALETTARQLPPAPALRALLASGEAVELGSQGRLVLPKKLAFESDDSRLELTWELEGGVLIVTHAAAREAGRGVTHAAARDADRMDSGPPAAPEEALPDAKEEQNSPGSATPSALGPRGSLEPERAGKRGSSRTRPYGPLPDGLTLPGPVQEVALGRIHGFDPDLEPEEYDRSLAEDIAEQGMLRPVVLAGPAPHRVIDGRKRLLVAQAIKLETVPAVVLSNLSREDQARLRYLLETTNDRWAIARQLRVMARLHVNGASLEALSGLLRKKKRTVQRYLRIAQDNALVDAIERGEISMLEAERRAGLS